MKKKFVSWMLLALAVGMMASGCGKDKESETDCVDLTVPPFAVEEEEP